MSEPTATEVEAARASLREVWSITEGRYACECPDTCIEPGRCRLRWQREQTRVALRAAREAHRPGPSQEEA